MIKIAAFWELSWNSPIKEIDLWIYPMRDFGVDELYMVPISGIDNKKITEKASLEEVMEENEKLQIVFCTEDGEYSLQEFQHPENVLYIFGRTNYSPFNTMKTKNSISLRVETKLNGGMLWGHQAASIILYDRLRKNTWQL